MAVVLVVALIVCAIWLRERSGDAQGGGEVPEEVLARQMPDEYPGYKKLFESQARSRLDFPLMR